LPVTAAVTSASIHVPSGAVPIVATTGPIGGAVFHVIVDSDHAPATVAHEPPLLDASVTQNRSVACVTGAPSPVTSNPT
jgi:hypothetical protein